ESLGAPHSGLGTGTQLALAVATILERMRQREIKSVECLAELMGRGRRSAVGTYGFGHGGLIVERGKLAAERISPLDQRLPLPAPWRFVLVRPQLDSGLHGAAEHQAFEKLPAVPPATAEQLNRLLDEQLLPAVRAHDFTRFSQSLYEFGYASGCCFAPAQGGAYRGPRLTQLVELIRSLGVVGVGQSSWGPTLFAAVPDDVAAHRLVQDLRLLDDDLLLTIAAPQNAGALVNGRPLLSTSGG
ncbi:MAG: GHMP kinase, partial [Planctomycetota bacterium]